MMQAHIEAECVVFDPVKSLYMRDMLLQLETIRFTEIYDAGEDWAE